MKAQEIAQVIYLVEQRRRMLLLIEAKVRRDSKLCTLVLRSAKCDRDFQMEVLAKSGGLPE